MAKRKRGRPKGSTSRRKGRPKKKTAFKLKLKKDSLRSIASVLFLSVSFLITLSYLGISIGPDNFLQVMLDSYLGVGSLLLPVIFFIFGVYLTGVKWGFSKANVWIGFLICQVSLITLISLFQLGSKINDGGKVGFFIASSLGGFMSNLGAIIVVSTILFISFLIIFNASLTETLNLLGDVIVGLLKALKEVLQNLFRKEERISLREGGVEEEISKEGKEKGAKEEEETVLEEAKKEMRVIDPLKKSEAKERELDGLKEETVFANIPLSDQIWEYPPLSLLSDKPPVAADRGDIKENAHKIEKALDSFGIRAKVVEVNCGPAVTQYALELMEGTKISKVTALGNDLALALAAPTGTVRIEAPIPGRSLVGIEVPNYSPTLVTLKNTMQSDIFRKVKSKLTVILGHDVSGQSVVGDIYKMPHVLIAGATGSGKTVCLNSFIATLLFQNAPHELKFIMVDPKRVELIQYNGIPHLLTPVIDEVDKTLSAMKWCIAEMERRYRLFQKARVRNINAYNEISGFQALPNILIVVDELADLMMNSAKEFELTICRLAQMARATGIHLILATQRPSVDVLTGLIKANIPCRLAFNVTSSVDSRVILDQPGAEKLLGKGDMLYLPPDKAKPQRIQGVYVSDEELKALQDYLKDKGAGQVEYHEEVTEFSDAKVEGRAGEMEPEDDLFEEAVDVVCSHGRASASLLQRRLRIGYARAARVLDQLEQRGVVSSPDGSKPRKVLVASADEFFGTPQESEG